MTENTNSTKKETLLDLIDKEIEQCFNKLTLKGRFTTDDHNEAYSLYLFDHPFSAGDDDRRLSLAVHPSAYERSLHIVVQRVLRIPITGIDDDYVCHLGLNRCNIQRNGAKIARYSSGWITVSFTVPIPSDDTSEIEHYLVDTAVCAIERVIRATADTCRQLAPELIRWTGVPESAMNQISAVLGVNEEEE